MQEQFKIKTGQEFESDEYTLALIVGNDYFSYSISTATEIVELKRYYLKKTEISHLNTILSSNPVLSQRFEQIVTAFDFNTNILIPVDMNNGDTTSLMYLNQSDPQDHVINEVVTKWQLTNIYSIPYALLNWVLTFFPSTQLWHVQSVCMNNTTEATEKGMIDVDIRDKNFNVVVTQQDELLLAQNYSYTAPADVLFYLLKICETFSITQEEVQLNIAGLVDENSGLFKTLYDYFLNINLKTASWQMSEYPTHYFTLLNQVALCGS